MSPTPDAASKADAIAAHRSRYEALRSAGQGETARGLPPPSPKPAPPVADAAVRERVELPGGLYWTGRVARGETLRLTCLDGTAAAALVCWRADEPTERLNVADTVKVQWSASVRRGRVILSDMGRVLLSCVEDSSAAHDALAGGTAAPADGEPYRRSTRENLLAAVGKLGLGRRDIPPCLTFFAPVTVAADGRLAWAGTRREAGDFVELRAEMDLLLAVSNTRHPVDPDLATVPGPLEILRLRLPAPGADDACRNAGPEARRAFAATDALHDDRS